VSPLAQVAITSAARDWICAVHHGNFATPVVEEKHGEACSNWDTTKTRSFEIRGLIGRGMIGVIGNSARRKADLTQFCALGRDQCA